MLAELVETLVIKCGHQLGIDRLAISILYRQRPLFLLSWFQTITEGGPLQTQFLVRQRPLDLRHMGVALVLLHPGEGHHYTMTIFFFVYQFPIQESIALIHGPTLQQLVTREKAIDNMHILIRGANLNGNRRTIIWELGSRLIEPVFRLCGWHLVIE